MREKPHPRYTAPDLPLPPIEDLPQIDMPVIDIQDVEHNAGPDTRMPNSGLKVAPRLDSAEERDFAKEDAEAIEALEELEKTLKRQAPG